MARLSICTKAAALAVLAGAAVVRILACVWGARRLLKGTAVCATAAAEAPSASAARGGKAHARPGSIDRSIDRSIYQLPIGGAV